MALILHCQFAHPTHDKLICLINNAGTHWSENNELKEKIKRVSENCTTCKIYRKAPPRPMVGLLMATPFQETVAMDLKFYRGNISLHLTEPLHSPIHFNRYPKQKPQHHHQRHIQQLDISLWLGTKILNRKWRRTCQ